MILTDEFFLSYQRCSRQAYLDVWGDINQQIPLSPFILKLQQDSIAHRHRVLAGMTYQQPQYPKHNLPAGVEATEQLMREGVNCIYSGILQVELAGGLTLMSRPDFLIKYSGESRFGDWFYVPGMIKLGKRPKLSYQLAVTYAAYLLSLIQLRLPDFGFLFLRSRNYWRVNIPQRLPQMQEKLTGCLELGHEPLEPEVFISRYPCSYCSWLDVCYGVASQSRHLSLVPGITPNRYQHLKRMQITTLEALAEVDLAQLSNVWEVEENIAQQVILQAQSLLKNQPFLKPAPDLLAHNLVRHPIELYFDIEAEQELNVCFLLGVLVVDRVKKTENYHSFLAKSIGEEEQIWLELLNLFWQYPDAPIYHFCNYEALMIKQLGNRYHTPESGWKPLLNRLIDVHEWVTQTTIMPVESYSLKNLARWLGFRWQNPQANGGQCVYWYSQWLKTANIDYLEMISQYNHDDCRATFIVQDWLCQFLNSEKSFIID